MNEKIYLTFAKEVVECRRYGYEGYDELHNLFMVLIANDLLADYQLDFLKRCFFCDMDELISNSEFHINL